MTIPADRQPAPDDRGGRVLRLGAVDDHPFILNGILWTVRELAPWITVFATAASVTELLEKGGGAADVVLLDLDLGVPETAEESDPTHNVQTILAAGPRCSS